MLIVAPKAFGCYSAYTKRPVSTQSCLRSDHQSSAIPSSIYSYGSQPKPLSPHVNFGFTSVLLDALKKHNNKAPVLISSSIQAEIDNPYGCSNKAGEDLLFDYSKETGAAVYVYRLHNVFGKWCRPNYNSVVATFCHNIAHELPISVSDPLVTMDLIYIDDLVNEFINALDVNVNLKDNYCYVELVYTAALRDMEV